MDPPPLAHPSSPSSFSDPRFPWPSCFHRPPELPPSFHHQPRESDQGACRADPALRVRYFHPFHRHLLLALFRDLHRRGLRHATTPVELADHARSPPCRHWHVLRPPPLIHVEHRASLPAETPADPHTCAWPTPSPHRKFLPRLPAELHPRPHIPSEAGASRAGHACRDFCLRLPTDLLSEARIPASVRAPPRFHRCLLAPL
mmetsp:Transcript_63501/g.161120  ORF Transcript_63501/g.161120 Transcript_63501/m.161120 type:complete len:202 (+) Transcript_63501:280-885(+)